MSGLPSDEVAEDYKGSLEDLMTNDRYQISNLTLIAKENTEHAEAISRVLQNHINRAPPARKLPALYVLDSIAKNVGSPYTIYFGRNLHQTFMHAYSQVDTNVRRKLEEMLKTWREPVPGALSTTPVFPISSTQSIVDNLNKFRAATAANSRFQTTPIQGAPARVASTQQPYRQTATPPQTSIQYPPALPTHIRSPQPHSVTPTIPGQSYSQAPLASYVQQYSSQSAPYYHPPQPVQAATTTQYGAALIPQYPIPSAGHAPSSGPVDIQKLHVDIDDLTTDAKIECATHPMDQAAQRHLTTLQTLKEILESGSTSEEDLINIRNTIMKQMADKLAAGRSSSTPATAAAPTHIQQQYVISPPQPLPTPAPPAPSIFNTTNLAELLRLTANQQEQHRAAPQSTLYSQPHSGVATPLLSGAAPPVAPAPVTENPLLAQLRASGLLSMAPTPPQGLTPPLSSLNTLATDARIEVSLSSAALKIPRPYLIQTFLNARPNQCSTCGRRFTSDEIGRAKKAAHLDWHFKTKERMLEAEKRGQNRSWYVDERDWIASKEYEDDTGPADANGAPVNGAPATAKKKVDFVRAPTDPMLRSLPCPIDQEPFKSEWSEEVQDFIWKDAIHVGGRYYHASCYAEITRGREKDGASTPAAGGIGRTATPDSVLGKRKAEASLR
ncbi:uncharacterized protein A1O9_12636 [Exophiala aquamarina CBS 119918]|uniref:CID domain-containing protein n=1 Tax=Exophiala aquamarina CBS 119918 TaxID=1182545 RepID=A0A072NUM3_9EURO|nr:uncharacterized protein A1O9_12636 [Exophiala aquamarina CBS 119918]KEF51286.1 hypothetical protein A1O9_12636 [Exophiala aquamarina CBS 119918]